MFKSGFVLDSADKLRAAQHNQSMVAVWQRGKIVHYGGPIDEITDIAVIIGGGTFFIDIYEFRIR